MGHHGSMILVAIEAPTVCWFQGFTCIVESGSHDDSRSVAPWGLIENLPKVG